ncbi:NAD(P)+ transhydrogenase beta chain [Agrobacterium rosae]|uniref:NAD(P)+ transhydrogenase beta chain n=1 Tax=Agrobacterium rosae TaxID=1972867 RepID=UPI002A168BE5|nr:NAD(P)+ transhydrogenase beta chain [Agrobacterium rosae]MDX8312983.1 NAD(P)+ transhydrogenase beta chain [Agrobacterium rosae]
MKPSYGTSKRYLWGSFWAAWGAIFLLLFGALAGSREAVDIAPMAIPALLTLIAAMLGLHRHYGSKDFEATAIAETLPPSTTPYNAQDDPTGPEAQR